MAGIHRARRTPFFRKNFFPVRGPADSSALRTSHEDRPARGPADPSTDHIPTGDQPTRGPAGSETGRLAQTHSDQLLLQWVRRWWQARRKLREVVQDELEERAHQMKRAYDRRRPQPTLHEGDWVLLSTHAYNPYEQYHKGHPRYSGPYVILKRVHPNAYEIEGAAPTHPSSTKHSVFKTISAVSPAIQHPSPTDLWSTPATRPPLGMGSGEGVGSSRWNHGTPLLNQMAWYYRNYMDAPSTTTPLPRPPSSLPNDGSNSKKANGPPPPPRDVRRRPRAKTT